MMGPFCLLQLLCVKCSWLVKEHITQDWNGTCRSWFDVKRHFVAGAAQIRLIFLKKRATDGKDLVDKLKHDSWLSQADMLVWHRLITNYTMMMYMDVTRPRKLRLTHIPNASGILQNCNITKSMTDEAQRIANVLVKSLIELQSCICGFYSHYCYQNH